MPVRFVLGRAGVGKTHHCLASVAAELEHPTHDGRLVLLVPEQASFQMERALVSRLSRGGYWRAEVLSFTRLSQRLESELGPAEELLEPGMRVLALRAVLSQSEGMLRSFGAAVRTPGFMQQLDRFLHELISQSVSPVDLSRAAERTTDPRLRERAGDVARLLTAYRKWLGDSRLDAADRLSTVRRRLSALPWLSSADVFVDGFAGFTAEETATLVELGRTSRQMELTLLVDPHAPVISDPTRAVDPLHLFGATEKTFQELARAFERAGVPIRPPLRLVGPPARFESAAQLARLEAGLATPVGLPIERSEAAEGDSQRVRVLECGSRRAELREAARFVRQRVAASGGRLSFRDFALILRDLEPDAELVAEVFDEHEIPYFLDRRRPLREHVLYRFLKALLDVVASDFSAQATRSWLASGLLPIAEAERDRLETVVVEEGVRGLSTWRRPRWDFASLGRVDERSDAARLRLMDALGPLLAHVREGGSVPAGTWATAIVASLERLKVRETLSEWMDGAQRRNAWETAEIHRVSWETVKGAIEDIHRILGAAPIDFAALRDVLLGSLEEATIGLAPPTLDQVLVGSIERSRHPNIRYAWLAAFNEGIFPAPTGQPPLFSESERAALCAAGIAPALRHDEDVFAERLLAYIAMTRPSHGLVISYATSAADGSAAYPSPLLADVLRGVPELRIEQPDALAPPTCLPELARGYLALRESRGESGRLPARYEELVARLSVASTLGARLDWLLRGRDYTNRPEPLGNFCSEKELVWRASPSAIEAYLQCPYQHFARYGLRLQPERGPKSVRMELGSEAHSILAATVRAAIMEERSPAEISDDQWLSWLHAAVDRHVREEMPADLAERQPGRAFLSGALHGLLRELVLAHAQRWRLSAFAPTECELAFGGPEAKLPPLRLVTAAGTHIEVEGRIDRVDAFEDEDGLHLIAYDYKSWAAAPIASAKWLTGSRLQLFLYALALQRGLAERKAGLVGAFLAPLYPSTSAIDSSSWSKLDESAQRMRLYRPTGLIDCDYVDKLVGKDRTLAGAVANVRWKNDGDLYANCEGRGNDELVARLSAAEETALQAAAGVEKGAIDVEPLLEGRTLACHTCDYAALCRFDVRVNRARRAELSLPIVASPVDTEEEAS